ncbi:DUF2541 family protein, partial [Escherichia coli]|uniref:DUF2541 family protein n=1 Tax=Escherichia coli TaxID=562 RepID=UPI00214AF2F1
FVWKQNYILVDEYFFFCCTWIVNSAEIKEGQTTDWININSDNDNKRCVSKITFSGHTVNSSDMATLKIIGDD